MSYKNCFASYWQDSYEHHFSLKLPSSCGTIFPYLLYSIYILYTKAGKRLHWPNCLWLYDKWSWESSCTSVKPPGHRSLLKFNHWYWIFHIDVSCVFQNNFCFSLCNVLRHKDGHALTSALRKITWSNQTLMNYTHWFRWKYSVKRTDSNGRTSMLMRSLTQTWWKTWNLCLEIIQCDNCMRFKKSEEYAIT